MTISGLREASRLIFVDELTGLYNRRFMRQYLRDRLQQFLESRTPLCVIMLDLDGFKQVNDTYGHMDGDLILKELATRVREELPAGSYAIRFAGDEFFLFLEGVDAEAGMIQAEAVRECVAATPFVTPKVPDGVPLFVSVGVASWPEDGSSAGDLIEAADRALYESKRLGKNCVSRAEGVELSPEEALIRRLSTGEIVGRETEIEELQRPIQERSNSMHRFLLIAGEPGLGKSRLLTEVMQSPEARDLRCFFRLCTEAQQTTPYSTLAHSIRECLTQEPDSLELLRSRLSNDYLHALGKLLPGLGDTPPPEGHIDPADRRGHIFDGMVEVLSLLSESEPLFLFLDEAQFADPASLAVLARMVSDEVGNLIVYAACRADIFDEHGRSYSSWLPNLIEALCEFPSFVLIGLCPLMPTDLEEMFGQILGDYKPSPAFLQRMYEASQGIPLFVEETIKSLIARGSLRLVDDAWNLDAVPPGDIPASLESAVRQGIEALDPETRALISKAAVAGPSFDLTLLADVLGKDPGETQELVDRGKKNRVFDSQEGIADEDDVRFLSQCFREVVYAGLRRAERKKTHRAVGEAAERLAGDRVDQVLGTLAYHFERSDDSNKAEFYTQRVQEVSDQLFAPIDPSALGTESGLEPLDEGATEAALKFLRSLPVAIKNLRLYPAGNQLLEQSIANANATLGEALAATEAIGFTELDKSLRLNGKDIDDRATAQAKNELLQIFNDHGVRRCTFQRGITDADLYALLQILSGPAQAGTSDEHSWSDRLSQAGIEHVRIFPVIYLESEDRHPGWRREQSDRLDESHLPIVRNVLRSLTAVVDNIRLYPKESELITTTLDALEQQIDELFREVPSLTIGKAEGQIVINAIRAKPRTFGVTIEVLDRLIEAGGLTSLTVRAGVTRAELRSFLEQLADPPSRAELTPDFWQGVLDGHGIRTIEVGTKTYAAAGADKSTVRAGVPLDEDEEEPQDQAEEEEDQVSEWLATGLDEFLDTEFQRDLSQRIQELSPEKREEAIQRVWGRIAEALEHEDKRVREMAARVAIGVLQPRSGETHWLFDLVAGILPRALVHEDDAKPFAAEVELSALIIERLLERESPDRAARIAGALASTRDNKSRNNRFSTPIRSLVHDLESDLLGMIGDCSDTDSARSVARLLQSPGRSYTVALRQQLQQAETPRLCRFLSVFEMIEPAPRRDFFFLLLDSTPRVRGELTDLMSRLQHANATAFLSSALADSDPRIVISALACLAKLGDTDLIDHVSDLMSESQDEQVLNAACKWLGTTGSDRAVVPLTQLLRRRPRLFGLIAGAPDAARLAAVHALVRLNLPEAHEALLAARKDSVPAIRDAVNYAIQEIG